MALWWWWVACSGIAWERCDDGFQCATLEMADGAEIAVSRHRARRGGARVAVMVQGGPGASSIDLMQSYVRAYREQDPLLWHDITWVAMDNRGVGRSDPIDCVDDDWYERARRLHPSPADPAARAALQQLRDDLQDGCLADRSADDLERLGTSTYLDDLDAFRDALGVEELDLIGMSAGSQIGAAYAARYPEHVGRFVIDALVPPEHDREVFLEGQRGGFEQALDLAATRCDLDPKCPSAPFRESFETLVARAAKAPLPAPSDPEGRALWLNELRWATASLLYSARRDPLLQQAVADAREGDAALYLSAADDGWQRNDDGSYDQIYERYWAIGCLEWPWNASWGDEEVWDLAADMDARDPWFGASVLSGELGCVGWPAQAEAVSYHAPTAPPLLVVAGLYDPASPYDNALRMLDELGNDSHLLTYDGPGHVAFGADSSGCTYDIVRSFLIEGVVRSNDCPSYGR